MVYRVGGAIPPPGSMELELEKTTVHSCQSQVHREVFDLLGRFRPCDHPFEGKNILPGIICCIYYTSMYIFSKEFQTLWEQESQHPVFTCPEQR